jgi:hypothetical protein
MEQNLKKSWKDSFSKLGVNVKVLADIDLVNCFGNFENVFNIKTAATTRIIKATSKQNFLLINKLSSCQYLSIYCYLPLSYSYLSPYIQL